MVAREVFTRFKRYANDVGDTMQELLKQINASASVYREFIQSGSQHSGTIDQLGLFAYRTGVLESEVIKPLVVYLLDPQQSKIPSDQLTKALSVIESWMVRRMLVRATTKNYNQIVAELIHHLRGKDRSTIGDDIETFFVNQKSQSRYWPDNDEVREELRVLPAYRRLGRGRLRMVIESIEDHLRGWIGTKSGLGSERVTRGKLAIEHVMPRKWTMHWPLPDGSRGEGERDALIHTIGNLTLLTSRLNSKVSNGPWVGESGKRQGLEAHDVLVLNRELLKVAQESWTDSMIRSRSDALAQLIVEIWPTPEGYKSGFAAEKVRPRHRVDLSDLLSAGSLQAGATLTPRQKKHKDKTAILLPDGRIDLAETIYSSPSEAAKAITGTAMNGWWFFLVDQQPRRSLKDVRIEYLQSIAADPDEDGEDDQDEA